uniref:Large ribosomal subunit protein uL4c n=1 Tax=Proboscia sp. TaxID=1923967 RepID=A0A2U9NM73_9STRA|nr:ribosomal protein L4 [Proboscia sp.]
MTIKKFVKYNVIKSDNLGSVEEDFSKLNLSILEKSGNYVVHKDVSRQQIQQKQGTVSTKTRSEVRGGGRKPWRQKGTGRARAGSNRSPLWKGGGVIFGPKTKKVKVKVNKKERRLALQTLLYSRQNDIFIIESLENIQTNLKTKPFIEVCQALNLFWDKKVLLIVSEKTHQLKFSTRNIKNIELISVSHLNTLSLLKAKKIYITTNAITKIKETFCD